MNRSNEIPQDNSQKISGESDPDKTVGGGETQETQQYDKYSDPKYQEVLLNFFRKNDNEKEPLFNEIQKVLAEGSPEEIGIFRQSYIDQLSDEAKTYLDTEYTLKIAEQKENARGNFNPEQETADIKKIETYESLQVDLESDPEYQKVLQVFWSKLEEGFFSENEENRNEKVMIFTLIERSSTEIQDFIERNPLTSEARDYLEAKKFKAKTLETKGFE